MRFNNIGSFRLSTHLLKKKEFQKHLMTILNLNSNEIEHIFDTNKNILTFPRHRVINNCMMFQKYNVNIKPLIDLQYSFLLSNHCLEHRINVLKDIGISNLNVSMITKMPYLFRKNISKFKEIVNIPIQQSITRNIFDKLGNAVPNSIFYLESNDTLTFKQYHQTCLLHCKTKTFDLPYLDDKILLYNYGQFKSISMIAETLKVLRIDLGYDKEMIKKHPFVITASVENIRLLLNNFDNICGIPIVPFLKKYPYILFQDINNIKQLLVSFKRYNISDKQIKKNMTILKIDNDTFLERIEMIKRHSDLNIWLKHPRILDMIIHIDMLKDRIAFLHVTNRLKWARPHTILSKKINLMKFLQNNSSIASSKKALRYIFLKELGTDNINLINMLARHSHWKRIGFVEIDKMLKYLKKHFKINEICQNIHIVLYAQSRVEEVLADLKQQYSNSTEYSFTNNQYLALCLYTLEKDNHFTGDGICSNKCIKQLSSDLLNIKNINDKTNISNDIHDLNIENSDSIHNLNDDLRYPI